jgi:di/tricarboxylate transporter
MSSKTIGLVFVEASVVGIFLILLVYIVKQFEKYLPIKSEILILFLAGFLFHSIFEYTGVNAWYSKEYCKLLQ